MSPCNVLSEFKEDMDAQFAKLNSKIDAVLAQKTCKIPNGATFETKLDAANALTAELKSKQNDLEQQIADVKNELKGRCLLKSLLNVKEDLMS
jgi:predicted  nucleic acid-binding Zn-ribbon protein